MVGKKEINEKKIKKMNYSELKISWEQQGNKLLLNSIYGQYFFHMPKSWKLSQVPPQYLRLIEVIIFRPFWKGHDLENFLNENWIPNPTIYNKIPKRVGIAFSGGDDSCACVALLPEDSVLVYLKRVWDSPQNHLKHGQQLKCLNYLKEKWNRRTLIIPSNIELLAKHSIKRIGFTTDYVPLVPTILVAQQFGLKYLCTGLIGAYLKGGARYQAFLQTDHYKFWDRVFKKSGLEMFWPVAGCSDRITNKICQKAKIPSQPCIRNDKGSCGRCFKCFRKNYLIQATHPNKKETSGIKKPILNKEILYKMGQRPISRIFAKKLGWIIDDNIQAHHLKMNFSFELGYYPPFIETLVPDPLRNYVLDKLDFYCRPMTAKELDVVHNLNLTKLVKNPKKMSKNELHDI